MNFMKCFSVRGFRVCQRQNRIDKTRSQLPVKRSSDERHLTLWESGYNPAHRNGVLQQRLQSRVDCFQMDKGT